jgi:hypothetical protein
LRASDDELNYGWYWEVVSSSLCFKKKKEMTLEQRKAYDKYWDEYFQNKLVEIDEELKDVEPAKNHADIGF